MEIQCWKSNPLVNMAIQLEVAKWQWSDCHYCFRSIC